MLRHDFDLWPNCDLDLVCRNLNHVRNIPSHYALSFCEVSSNLLQQFMSYRWDTICNGRADWLTDWLTDWRTDERTDGRTDGAILIFLSKFLRRHKKYLSWIEKSVTRDHCSASLGKPRDADQWPSWQIFLSTPYTHARYLLSLSGHLILERQRRPKGACPFYSLFSPPLPAALVYVKMARKTWIYPDTL